MPAMQETQVQSPGEGNDNSLQYSCLEKTMNSGAWRATLHGVARVRLDLMIKPLPPPPPLRFNEM